MSIYTRLAHLAKQSITAQLGTASASGAWTSDGSDPVVIACYIEGEVKQVRDTTGRETVSNIQVITLEDNQLDAKLHRFTLPSRYSPNFEVQALNVIPSFDDDGVAHEEVVFA